MQTTINKIKQLYISLTQRGLPTTLYWSAFGYLKPNRFFLLAQDLSTNTIRVQPRHNVHFTQWTAKTMHAWRDQQHGLSTEFFQDVIDGVDTCAVALVDGALAGMIWIYRPEHTSRLFHLQAYEAELNQGYILPAYRGAGLFSDVLTFACELLQKQGCRTVYAGVHTGNSPSRHAFHNAGFRDIGQLKHFMIVRPKVYGHQVEPKRSKTESYDI